MFSTVLFVCVKDIMRERERVVRHKNWYEKRINRERNEYCGRSINRKKEKEKMGAIWHEQGSWNMTASWRGRGNEGKVIE